jgi:hypothetical protein
MGMMSLLKETAIVVLHWLYVALHESTKTLEWEKVFDAKAQRRKENR